MKSNKELSLELESIRLRQEVDKINAWIKEHDEYEIEMTENGEMGE